MHLARVVGRVVHGRPEDRDAVVGPNERHVHVHPHRRRVADVSDRADQVAVREHGWVGCPVRVMRVKGEPATLGPAHLPGSP